MTFKAIAIVVFVTLFSSKSLAQNTDNFEHLITTLQDKNSKDIIYTVQLGAFMLEHKKGHFKDVEDLFSQTYSDGMTRFFSRLFTSLTDAVTHRDNMRLKGYPDAFVLGLDGGFDRILIELD